MDLCLARLRAVVTLSCVAALAAPAHAVEAVSACQVVNVQVVSGMVEDARDACAGAAAAVAFFTAQGVSLRQPVVLEIIERLPDPAPATAAGIYLKDRQRIYMLRFREFRQFKTWFHLPIDREIYRSLAAHEVAHAIAEANFAIDYPSIQAREYLAYVTLFATMSPRLRQRVMQAIPGKGFQDEHQISPIVYMFDPMLFGAQSYRHYLLQADGPSFFRSVLAGMVLRE